jgi:hypothetical protein
MKHLQTFESYSINEEIRLDRLHWYSGVTKDSKPGVKGWKGSKNSKYVRHQGNKATRMNAKKFSKEILKGNDEPDIDFKNPNTRTE